MRDSSEIVIGIDLGTTHSLVAWCGEAGPQVLRDASGDARVPSVLQFDDQGGVTIGWKARLHAVEHPESTVYSIKRLMGRGYEELLAAGELTHLAYAVVKRATDVPGRDIAAALVNGRLLTPPEISAMILRELKDRAAAHLGCDVTKAVITVPAYFDDAQRQATRDAGRIAGLEVLRIVNEPTAAALAYGLGVRTQLEAREGRDEGATEGGALLARRLRSPSAADEVNTPKPGQPRGSPGSRQLPLAGSCSPAGPQPGSLDASTHRGPTDSEQESLVAIYDLGGGTFDVSILRLCEGVFEVLSTHGNTNLGGDDLDREIMMLVYREIREQFQLDVESPATRQSVRSLAESVKIRLSTEASATVEINLGSGSIYRRTINRAEFEGMIDPWIEKTLQSCRQALRDAGMNPAGIDQVVLVGGSTRIPLVRQRVRDLFQRQPYTALNPDEVVALGAAVQAGILSGIRGDALLLDVVPLSLGIETMGGAMGKLILRNTRIPCQATERFSTFVDGQISVKINVLQGERELARDCRSLGEFELCGLPPMPAGIPKILVTFLIDENGILHVTAREERSKKEASIQIVPTHGLTAEEVRRMELAAYEHAREDMSAHRLIDLRNQVAFDTGKAEQMLAKVGDELSPSARAEIETAMRDLRQLAGTSDDPDTIFAALSTFDRKTLRLAELAILVTLRHDDGAPPGAQHHSED